MRIEKYICDFCKKEFAKEEVDNFYADIRKYDLCESCYKKAQKIKERYERDYKIIWDNFKYDLDKLIKKEDR